MKLSNKNSELLEHPSDIGKHIRRAELCFSPHPKQKAGVGGHLAELNSHSKRKRFRSNYTFWENVGHSDLVQPISGLLDCSEVETTELVGKDG